jgi:hypothetical protein
MGNTEIRHPNGKTGNAFFEAHGLQNLKFILLHSVNNNKNIIVRHKKLA